MSSQEKQKERKTEYRSLKSTLLSELDRLMGEEECDIHRAFVLETAQVFSSTASGFAVTDGQNEWGIDFCRSDVPVFTIAQCKCPERVSLETEDKPHQYDRSAVEELLTGIKYVTDEVGTYAKAPLALKHFKKEYHESLQTWPKDTRLQAALAIFGELTGQAENYFRNQYNQLESDGVELLLWDWEKFNELLFTPQVSVDNMSVTLTIEDPDKDLLRRSSPLCFARAIDLVNAWEKYQWNIVDWNVRAEIRNSPTNKRIQNTLLNPSGRRNFHDYNNGILIVCRQFTYSDLPGGKQKEVHLKAPQVVNGCQTLLSLIRAYLDLSEKDKEDFRDKVRVQVKVIANQSQEFLEKIIFSSNDQNPMTARSLKSNTPEQKKLQESFQRYSVKWFYERKDGQFDGFRSFGQKTPWFRPAEYQVSPGKKRYRIVDNQALAQEWLAFIGWSHETLRGGLHIFDDDHYYGTAFLTHPNSKYWEEMCSAPANPPKAGIEGYMEEGAPSIPQYLLAHAISMTIDHQKVSFQRNRAEAIERLGKRGKIKLDASGKPLVNDVYLVESALSKDDKYLLGIVINNMRDVMIELFCMVLCLRYGPLDDTTCGRILKYPPVRKLLEDPYAGIPEDASKAENRHILNLCYEFIKFSVDQYVVKYGGVIRAQPRLKSYLAQRATVDNLRSFVLEVNEEKVPGWVADWCPGQRSFIRELPDLE